MKRSSAILVFIGSLLLSSCTGSVSDAGTVKYPVVKPDSSSEPISLEGAGTPAGLYISGGPRINEAFLQQTFVSGTLIRVGWKDIEPSEGKYDFTFLDQQIALARRQGKKVTLSITNGPAAPSWLYEAGAEPFDFEFLNRYSPQGNRAERMPVPWDEVYLSAWKKTISVLGERYSTDPTIALVHITGSSKNGFEMHLPEDPPSRTIERAIGSDRAAGVSRAASLNARWTNVGYSEGSHIESIQQTIDSFMKAFPKHRLDIEIHAVLGSDRTARAVFDYGYGRYGERFGLFAAWWSGKLQPWNEGLTKLMTEACDKSFCTLQLIGAQSRNPERLQSNSLIAALSVGQKMGADYFEIWEADIKNPALKEDLTRFASTVSSSINNSGGE